MLPHMLLVLNKNKYKKITINIMFSKKRNKKEYRKKIVGWKVFWFFLTF